MKRPLGIGISEKLENLDPDGGSRPHGVGTLIEVEVCKEEMNNSISLRVTTPISWLPFSRKNARAIANEILELLGPENEEETKVHQYRPPVNL